jgi:hypothetical protein
MATMLRDQLFLIEDLKTDLNLPPTDRQALLAVADWTQAFIAKPHKDLGRAGPVCPFTAVALDNHTLWLAAERSAGRPTAEIVRMIESYQQQLLAAQPVEGDGVEDKAVLVVFPDLPAAEARQFFDGVLQQIGLSSYDELGVVMGPFYDGNEGTALYNANFRPFTAPVPSLLMRLAVVSDWKFFLNSEDFLRVWKRRYGELGLDALAEQLRQLPWNAKRD